MAGVPGQFLSSSKRRKVADILRRQCQQVIKTYKTVSSIKPPRLVCRLRFLDFCNNSEVRHLFVHLPPDDDEGAGTLCVSPHPPESLQTKALFFIKNSHTSRLNKDTISDEVACNECSEDPIEFLELVLREVYLPLLAEQKDGTTTATVSAAATQGISAERIMDILHRMISNIQVLLALISIIM